MAAKKTDDSESLRRLGGGRWQTRDDRFTIEPQSGTWVILDAEQTDELGLPLVRGPYRSLTDAKEAIASARTAAAPESPLADQVEKAARRTATGKTKPKRSRRSAAEDKEPEERAPPAEPRWLTDLPPARRREARALIERLTAMAADDPEDIVRGALVRDAPDLARFAVVRRLRDLAEGKGGGMKSLDLVAAVAEVLALGRDRDLDVGWKLVDDEGRPIPLAGDDLRRRLKGR